ncbi:unnamed protein product [Pedinophyceae sp. YPF-701]|nr:unnamed protein product [Pedinophyceae sp. YPF-701]
MDESKQAGRVNVWRAQDALCLGNVVFQQVVDQLHLFPRWEPHARAPDTFDDAFEFMRLREEEQKKATKQNTAKGKAAGRVQVVRDPVKSSAPGASVGYEHDTTAFWMVARDYFRPITREDFASLLPAPADPLRDPDLRMAPLGRPYTEIWAEEDEQLQLLQAAARAAQLQKDEKSKKKGGGGGSSKGGAGGSSGTATAAQKRRMSAGAARNGGGGKQVFVVGPLQAVLNGAPVPPPTDDKDDVVCDVCMDGDSIAGNVILLCDGCECAVHQGCYGHAGAKIEVPEGPWFCDACKYTREKGGEPRQCCLCTVPGGAMREALGPDGQLCGKFAHTFCVQWIPEVRIETGPDGRDVVAGLDQIVKARQKLLCQVCQKGGVGACIQCQKAACRASFHPKCAVKDGLWFEYVCEQPGADDFEMKQYCRKHTDMKIQESTEGPPEAEGARPEAVALGEGAGAAGAATTPTAGAGGRALEVMTPPGLLTPGGAAGDREDLLATIAHDDLARWLRTALQLGLVAPAAVADGAQVTESAIDSWLVACCGAGAASAAPHRGAASRTRSHDPDGGRASALSKQDQATGKAVFRWVREVASSAVAADVPESTAATPTAGANAGAAAGALAVRGAGVQGAAGAAGGGSGNNASLASVSKGISPSLLQLMNYVESSNPHFRRTVLGMGAPDAAEQLGAKVHGGALLAGDEYLHPHTALLLTSDLGMPVAVEKATVPDSDAEDEDMAGDGGAARVQAAQACPREAALGCAPADEVEAEILALQGELLQVSAMNRVRLARLFNAALEEAPRVHAKLESDKADSDAIASFIATMREIKRNQKREARERAQREAFQAAEAATKKSRRGGDGGESGGGSLGLVDLLAVKREEDHRPDGDCEADKCCVCGDGRSEAPNQIVYCERCDLGVHQACYGVHELPHGAWLCWPCRKHEAVLASNGVPESQLRPPRWLREPGGEVPGGAHTVKCALCPNRRGAYLQDMAGDQWVHVVCAQYHPTVTINDTVLSGLAGVMPCAVEGLPVGRANRGSPPCVVCQLSDGAPVPCAAPNCETVFHPMCGRNLGFNLQAKALPGGKMAYKAFCDRHSKQGQQRGRPNADAEARAAQEAQLKERQTELIFLTDIRFELENVRQLMSFVTKREKCKKQVVRHVREIHKARSSDPALAAQAAQAIEQAAAADKQVAGAGDAGNRRALLEQMGLPLNVAAQAAAAQQATHADIAAAQAAVAAAQAAAAAGAAGKSAPSTPSGRKRAAEGGADNGPRQKRGRGGGGGNSRLPSSYQFLPLDKAFARNGNGQ